MFIDCPRKLIIQLPSDECHDYREEANDTRNSQDVGSNIMPNRVIGFDIWYGLAGILWICEINESCDGLVDLIVLDRSVYQHSNIVEAKSDDLNGVLESQSIVVQHQLVQESEDEECEVCRNRFT